MPTTTPSNKSQSVPTRSKARWSLFTVLLILVIAVHLINVAIYVLIIADDPVQQHPAAALHLHVSNDVVKESDAMDGINVDIVDDSDRITSLLKNAGVDVTPAISSNLPSWSSVVSQYGPKPIIIGLDTCQQFQSTVSKAQASISVAGMFNTGTNLLSELMDLNCHIRSRWQVPWGKHSPATWRFKHRAPTFWDQTVNITTVFPLVTIKDPYHWMGSMCRKSYATYWPHTLRNCPNLIRDSDGKTLSTVQVKYTKQNITTHTTLVGLWNDYNKLYVDATFPRLIIRYEDLLFHPEYVISKACECAGGTMKSHSSSSSSSFNYIKENAKEGQPMHDGASDLLSAITRYGNVERRAEGFATRDRRYAEGALSEELVDMFGYKRESTLT